jgi:hypothetical protein
MNNRGAGNNFGRGRGGFGRGRGKNWQNKFGASEEFGAHDRFKEPNDENRFFQGFAEDILLIAETGHNFPRWCPVNNEKYTNYKGLYAMFKTFINSGPSESARLLIPREDCAPTYLVATKIESEVEGESTFSFTYEDKNGETHALEYIKLPDVVPASE